MPNSADLFGCVSMSRNVWKKEEICCVFFINEKTEECGIQTMDEWKKGVKMSFFFCRKLILFFWNFKIFKDFCVVEESHFGYWSIKEKKFLALKLKFYANTRALLIKNSIKAHLNVRLISYLKICFNNSKQG